MIPVPASSSAPPPRLPLHSGGPPPLPSPSPPSPIGRRKREVRREGRKGGEERPPPSSIPFHESPPLPPPLALSPSLQLLLPSPCPECHPSFSPSSHWKSVTALRPPGGREGEGPPLFRYDADFAIAIIRNAGRRRITHSRKQFPNFKKIKCKTC